MATTGPAGELGSLSPLPSWPPGDSAGSLWWASVGASNSLLCSQTTASSSSVPPSLHASTVSNIFSARPPQPRESVLGISFKPYSPDSSPAPAPCTTCESARKRMVPRVVSGHPGPGPTKGGEGWREAGNGCLCPQLAQASVTGWCFPGDVRGAGGKGEDSDRGRMGGHHGVVWGVRSPPIPHLVGPLRSQVHVEPGSSWHTLVGSGMRAPWGDSSSP